MDPIIALEKLRRGVSDGILSSAEKSTVSIAGGGKETTIDRRRFVRGWVEINILGKGRIPLWV